MGDDKFARELSGQKALQRIQKSKSTKPSTFEYDEEINEFRTNLNSCIYKTIIDDLHYKHNDQMKVLQSLIDICNEVYYNGSTSVQFRDERIKTINTIKDAITILHTIGWKFQIRNFEKSYVCDDVSEKILYHAIDVLQKIYTEREEKRRREEIYKRRKEIDSEIARKRILEQIKGDKKERRNT